MDDDKYAIYINEISTISKKQEYFYSMHISPSWKMKIIIKNGKTQHNHIICQMTWNANDV